MGKARVRFPVGEGEEDTQMRIRLEVNSFRTNTPDTQSNSHLSVFFSSCFPTVTRVAASVVCCAIEHARNMLEDKVYVLTIHKHFLDAFVLDFFQWLLICTTK